MDFWIWWKSLAFSLQNVTRFFSLHAYVSLESSFSQLMIPPLCLPFSYGFYYDSLIMCLESLLKDFLQLPTGWLLPFFHPERQIISHLCGGFSSCSLFLSVVRSSHYSSTF
jgi:hypothetical protein